MVTRLKMLIPASGGARMADLGPRLQRLGALLGLPIEVASRRRYDEIERELISGRAHLAWAPPLVSARVESYGGRLLARAIRHGAATYRSALAARRGHEVVLRPGANLRAAWVDRESMGGYVLPQVYVNGLGFSGWEVFREERFVGSYARAREEVLAGRADVCGSAVHATTREGVARELGPELVVLGVSDACTNDGIVAGPALEAAPREEIERAISGLHLRDPELVRELFEAERFEPAPPGTYREVYRLVFAAMPGHPRWGARSPGADGASGGA